MKKQLLLNIFIILIVSLSAVAVNAETVRFGTFPIPLMVVDQDNGVFIELTKELAKRANLNIEIVVTPPKRALNEFLEKRLDVLFPALDNNFPEGQMPLKSAESIYIKKDFAFTPKGSSLLSTINDLEGKSVGITGGYPYVKTLTDNPLIRINTAPTDEQNTKMLMAGRIQAFVVEEKSGLKAFENTGLKDKIQYDPARPLSEQDVYFAFQKNDNGERLNQLISKALGDMKQDGTFSRIMKKADAQQ